MSGSKSITIVVVSLLLGFGAPAPAQTQPTGYEGYQVVHVTLRDEADLQVLCGLQSLGRDFQVWSEVVSLGLLEVRVAPCAQPALLASGLPYEIISADLQAELNKRYAGERDRGFFDSLRTYSEHVLFMQGLVAAHPDLAQMVNLGNSVQGRAMWALHISGPGYARPAVLYHGAEHGNEQAPASVVEYVANYLLTNYATDPNVAALVNEVEWYLLPIMNPDGYVANDRWNAHDVDLNRNWAGPGSGQDPWGGPYPFSEPETQHLRDFLLAHPTVRVHIDLHGYVPWIMWP
jgi:murein tripeptide amidase MpaA